MFSDRALKEAEREQEQERRRRRQERVQEVEKRRQQEQQRRQAKTNKRAGRLLEWHAKKQLEARTQADAVIRDENLALYRQELERVEQERVRHEASAQDGHLGISRSGLTPVDEHDNEDANTEYTAQVGRSTTETGRGASREFGRASSGKGTKELRDKCLRLTRLGGKAEKQPRVARNVERSTVSRIPGRFASGRNVK